MMSSRSWRTGIAGWARNGRELYYVDPDTKEMMVVETQTGPAFHAG
jgi:hypothetical protein